MVIAAAAATAAKTELSAAICMYKSHATKIDRW